MAHELLQKRYILSQFPTPVGASPAAGGLVDFNSTGDKFTYAPPGPIDVYRFGLISAAALDPDAGGFVMAIDKRPTAQSDTNRTEIDTLTRADAQTVAAGTVLYRDIIVPVAEANGDDTLVGGVTAQTSRINVGPSGPLRINPGEELVLEVTNAMGAAGTGQVWIEIVELGFPLPPLASGSGRMTQDVTGQ